jgi:phosphoribosylformimino-5-aminoimidazole carboxamide ribotide isomerase
MFRPCIDLHQGAKPDRQAGSGAPVSNADGSLAPLRFTPIGGAKPDRQAGSGAPVSNADGSLAPLRLTPIGGAKPDRQAGSGAPVSNAESENNNGSENNNESENNNGSENNNESGLVTNFVSDNDSAYYARIFRADELIGGHVIQLGPGNEVAAASALREYPLGLQIGGGITLENASEWLARGASHVIVTSWLFPDGELSLQRASLLAERVGSSNVVIDLSARTVDGSYVVFIDRWRKRTGTVLSKALFETLSEYCDEFLVHAIDVEGLQRGIDLELVKKLAQWSDRPVTYAGGAKSIDDLRDVHNVSNGRVDLTIGSALDLFGGSGVAYTDAVAFNKTVVRKS